MVSVLQALGFAWAYLSARWLGSVLNVWLLAFGMGSACFLLLVGTQLDRSFERDLAGIDAVVGAKGSPMQLILAGVFHIDVPPGNIALEDFELLKADKRVKAAIPISLGDNVGGFRIVGTTPAYAQLYKPTVVAGSLALGTLQAVLGAQVQATTQMGMGQRFAGSHGLGAGGEKHDAVLYTVTGVLGRCGCVLDRLVLTSSESVWQVHEKTESLDESDRAAMVQAREVSLALVQYNSPLAAATFVRSINGETSMQAAAPALEVTRLLKMLGTGTDVLRAFAAVMLLVAALSVFIALWNAVRERQADLALLRLLGGSAAKLALLLLLEAWILALAGSVLGLMLGHGLAQLAGWALAAEASIPVTGMLWLREEVLLVLGVFALATLAAILPAWAAYRIGVADMQAHSGV